MNAISHSNVYAFPSAAIAPSGIAPYSPVAEPEIAAPEPEPEPITATELAAVVESIANKVEPRHAVGACTVGRDALTKAIAIVKRATERSNSIPILGNVRLLASHGTMLVTATDLDLEINAMIETKAGDAFEATVPVDLLDTILRKAAASDEVHFRATETGLDVSATWGKLNYRLKALPVSDFPELSANGTTHRFTLPGKTFLDMLNGTKGAVSKEETRYYLNGIFFHTRECDNRLELRTAATDGHRLYRMDIEAPEGSAALPESIMPTKAVTVLCALLKGKACPATVMLEFQPQLSDDDGKVTQWGAVRILFDNVEIVSKLIDGTFPDYQRVMPTGNEWRAAFDAKVLTEAIESVALIGTARNHAVKLEIRDGACFMTVADFDSGSASIEIASRYWHSSGDGRDADGIEIGFNAKYMLAMIADAAPNGGEIELELSDPGSPTIMRGDRNDWLGCLMPMRV